MAKAAKIKVVGAGFSGLVSAYFLQKKGFQIEVIEREPEVGGLIQTRHLPLGLVETAANAFMRSELLERVAQDIGCELLEPLPAARNRYILREGRLRRWPLSFWESVKTLLRFLFARPKAPQKLESIEAWGHRCLGVAATQFLLAPALQGIYAGEPARLSASLILGRFFGPARTAKNKSKTKKMSVAPRNGMGEFMSKLRDYLADKGVDFRTETEFGVQDLKGPQKVPHLLALPPWELGSVLRDVDAELSQQLRQIEARGLTTLTVFLKRDAERLHGFGCLFPRPENFEALGVLANASIFPHRALPSHVSETWIYPFTETRSEEDWTELLKRERAKAFGQADTVQMLYLTHWPRAFPHYTLDLEKFLSGQPFKQLEKRGLFFMGNYLGSLGLTQILEKADRLADRIAKEYGRK